MKKCSIDGCDNKYHAKGYCKTHYNYYITKPKYEKLTCSVEECNNPVDYISGKLKMCTKHFARYRKHGNTDETKRNKKFLSVIDDFCESDNKLDYEFNNLNTLSIVARLFYGNVCIKCGWNIGECEAHHIIPVSKNGKDSLSNIEILCPNCHSLHHRNKVIRFSDESIQKLNEMFIKIKNDI